MIRQGTRRFLLLAAWLWLSCLPSAFARQALPSLPDPEWSNPADYASTTSPLKNRVGGAAAWSSGRFSNYDPESPEIATGSNGCEYESASGRRKWLNRDPIGEIGGINLYGFVGNDPINWFDRDGLDPAFSPGISMFSGLTAAQHVEASTAAAPATAAIAVGGVTGVVTGNPLMGLATTVSLLLPPPMIEITDPCTGKKTQVMLVVGGLGNAGRLGKQLRLRTLATDPSVSSVDRGWVNQERNSIARGQRTNIRVPPGKNLAHRRGFEAENGYGYGQSDLQDIDLHKLQHKHEGY